MELALGILSISVPSIAQLVKRGFQQGISALFSTRTLFDEVSRPIKNFNCTVMQMLLILLRMNSADWKLVQAKYLRKGTQPLRPFARLLEIL